MDLIERLGKATEGSRELDALIFAGTLGGDWVAEFESQRIGKWLVYCNTKFIDKGRQHRVCKEPPAYTISLDAALLLVPEGWFWQAGTELRRNEPCGFAVLTEIGEPGIVVTKIATPALALCIAALRAREAGDA